MYKFFYFFMNLPLIRYQILAFFLFLQFYIIFSTPLFISALNGANNSISLLANGICLCTYVLSFYFFTLSILVIISNILHCFLETGPGTVSLSSQFLYCFTSYAYLHSASVMVVLWIMLSSKFKRKNINFMILF